VLVVTSPTTVAQEDAVKDDQRIAAGREFTYLGCTV
jgi:hypothetical protein